MPEAFHLFVNSVNFRVHQPPTDTALIISLNATLLLQFLLSEMYRMFKTLALTQSPVVNNKKETACFLSLSYGVEL